MTRTSRADACDLIKRYFSETERFVEGIMSCECQPDNAHEFMTKALQGYRDASKITLVRAPPYQHESMGSVERFNQTFQRMVTTILNDSPVPNTYIPHAIQHAECVYNRIPKIEAGFSRPLSLVGLRKEEVGAPRQQPHAAPCTSSLGSSPAVYCR